MCTMEILQHTGQWNQDMEYYIYAIDTGIFALLFCDYITNC